MRELNDFGILGVKIGSKMHQLKKKKKHLHTKCECC